MIVGIDLGTTHSLIGRYTKEGPKLSLNSLGKYLTPSVVTVLNDGSIAVGQIAQERLVTHPTLTASLFKRDMGTTRKIKLGNLEFSSEALSSLILRALIDDVENETGQKVTEAVISVPAYFSDAQRKTTKIAGELAGIKVERLINEPTAAALAYGLQDKGEGKVLVIDLGGGTFDVSLLEFFDDIVEVHATAGDNFLGGEDFTFTLMTLFCTTHKIDITTLTRPEHAMLKAKIDKLKKDLSNSLQSEMNIHLLGKEYQWSFTEEEFTKCTEALIQRMRLPLERTIRDSKLNIQDIDEIVLVGGATRMPLMSKLVVKMFQRFPLKHIDPDQTIALGAIIASGMKAKNINLQDIILTDVAPYTLGIEIVKMNAETKQYASGFFMPMINRNSSIPVSRIKTVYPLNENQKVINIKVFQGEGFSVDKNIYLGGLDVDISSKKENELGVDIRFTYDVNGILQVETIVKATGKTQEVFLYNHENDMTKAEIKLRFETLRALKIHPRDQQENSALISRAERLYEEYLTCRDVVQSQLLIFQDILETQDISRIKKAREVFINLLQHIESDGE